MPRIGVSVAVPEPWGSELQRYRIGAGDPWAHHIPTHITLLPPHEVDGGELAALTEHLAEAARRTEPFQVHLRGTGTFRPVSPVVFVNVVEGIGQCERLASDVRRGPLVPEPAFPYHPHVTVAHDVAEESLEQAFADLEHYDATFDVDRMWMYLHDTESGWQPARDFPLGLSSTG